MAERSDSGVELPAEPLAGRLSRLFSRQALLGRWRRWLRRFGFGRWIATGVLALLLVVQAWNPPPVELLRSNLFDLYQNLKPRELTPQPVVIVDIDEESIAALGQWPWSRNLVAQLVDQITGYGAVAVAFDIVFPEADRMSPGQIAEDLTELDEAAKTELRKLPSNDQKLSEAIGRSRVVLGMSGYQRQIGDYSDPPTPAPLATLGGDPTPFLFRFPGAVRNLPLLESAAAGQAMFSLVPEQDGIVRRVPAMAIVQDRIVPTLAVEALRVATGQSAFALRRDEAGISALVVAGTQIPTDQNGRIWINYAPSDKRRYVSARDVLWGRAPVDSLAGKIVFVGTSAVGLLDIKATPLDPALPGVEVHAQLLETILSQSYLIRPHYAPGLELLITAGVSLVLIALVPVLGAFLSLLLGAVIAGTLALVSWQLYSSAQVLVDVAYPMMASLMVYGTLVYLNYFREEVQRRQVRSAFGQYLSPALVEQLARNPERLALGGETREMTILFTDIRGFTTISERFKSDPQGLTKLMNGFLTPLTNDVLNHQGTIDKYMGDAIMAFWNAPLPVSDHAEQAARAALAMLETLERVNGEEAKEAEAGGRQAVDLRIGVGINTGACVVGNMGSDQRFDYSVLGDAVNLASRLEGQSKTYGVGIVVGASSVAQLKKPFALIELDLIRVKGKLQPEQIYGLFGDEHLGASTGFQKLSTRCAALLDAYRAQDWAQALALIQQCRQLDREVGLGLGDFLDLYETRIASFREAPPGPNWDGVYVAVTK